MQESSSVGSRKLEYNTLLMNGYASFQNREVARALNCYQQALRLNPDALSCALVHSIIGVLHMHSCNYPEAIESFNEGLKLVENTSAERQSSSYEAASVLIKLHANSALCSLVIGEHKEALDRVGRCLAIVCAALPAVRSDLFQSLMYIFYRFTSFATLKAAESQGAESKYDDVTQACFYSTMAVNKDLCSTPDDAYRLQKKALEVWAAKREYGFMLISQRHLLHLANELNLKKEAAEYERQIQRTLESQKLQGVSDKTLFKGYQEKMKTAKEITMLLANFERQQRLDTQQHEVQGWRQATRLRLLQAINTSKRALLQGKTRNRAQTEKAMDQMQQTLKSLEGQRNILVQRNLQKSKFVIEAVNYLKAQSHRFLKLYETKKKSDLANYLSRWREAIRKQQRSQRQGSKLNPNPQQQISDPIGSNISSGMHSQLQTRSILQASIINDHHDQRGYNTTNPPPTNTDYRPNIARDPYYGSGGIQPQSSNISVGRIPPQSNQPNRSRFEPEVSPINRNQPLSQGSTYQSVSPIRNVDRGRPISPILTSRINLSEISFIYIKDDPQTNRKIARCIRKCETGQYLLKRHFTSDGGDEKFVKLTKNDIRWASDEEKITKSGKNQAYLLTDVKGIVYGKITQTMHKSCNKQLLPWKCFSLILKKRTLDMYCPTEEDIHYWVPGLSGAISRANPEKVMIGYSPGKMLWTKMFLKLNYYFNEPRTKHDRRYAVPFAVALTKFIKGGYQLPRKKK